MVEQPDARKGHGNAVLVAGLNDMVVPDGAAGLGDKLHARLVGPLDVVPKGEEGVASQSHTGHAGEPLPALFPGEDFRLLGEELLPLAVRQHVHAFALLPARRVQ